MVFEPKGSGAIDLAAGSQGINISNGDTVTAITRTSTGVGYTSIPTVNISPPQLAGGVQATATAIMVFTNPVTIANGGTGYTVNDVLTIVGGTPVTTNGTVIVTAVSAGVVTAITIQNFSQYTVLPTSPVSVTGGTGSGCTLNVAFAVNWL